MERIAGAVRETGIDPLVPQNLTFMALPRGERRAGGGNIGVHLEHEIEMAHLEDLGHHRGESRNRDPSLLRLGLFCRQQQNTQADAADVHHIGKVQQHRRTGCGAVDQVRSKCSLEGLRMGVVEPTLHMQDPNRTRLTGRKLHANLSTVAMHTSIATVLQGRTCAGGTRYSGC